MPAGVGFDKLKVRYAAHHDASVRSLICEQEFREIHAAWIQRNEEQSNHTETEGNGSGEEDTVATDASPESELRSPSSPKICPPPRSASKFLPPSSKILDSSPEADIDIPASSVPSPTLSISTISDLAPTEFGEIENDQEQTPGHDSFYFEDGNVEIVCGDTTFRVHPTVVSFSSPELRKIFSRPALLEAPTSEGCPRITISDSAEDFAMMLKMIYTPG